MAHNIKELPPFGGESEAPANDSDFAVECENAIRVIIKDQRDLKIVKSHISINKEFGPVCRVDFTTPDDRDGSVNRIMLWRLRDGKLAEFSGLNIPALPLK